MKRIKIKFFFQGNQFYIQKRFDEALASYNMAIKHNPTYSMAYFNRGLCLSDLNRLEDAIASYDLLNGVIDETFYHIGYMNMVFLHCEFSYELLNVEIE